MSINTWYLCIPPAALDDLEAEAVIDPDAAARYIHPEGADPYWKRPEPSLWTERNWLGLHSLLTTGQWAAQPLLGASITGGTPIGGDYCYQDSPVRYFPEDQVREIAAALSTVSEEALRATCDPDAMNALGKPPVGGWRKGDFEYLWDTFTAIRGFFHLAAAENYAVLVFLA